LKIRKLFVSSVPKGFLGCPVLDKNKKYVNFVDMLDITKAVLKAFGAFRAGRGGEKAETRESEYAEFVKTDQFNKATVKQCTSCAN